MAVVAVAGFVMPLQAQVCPSFFLPFEDTTTVSKLAQPEPGAVWPEERTDAATWTDSQGNLFLFGGATTVGGVPAFRDDLCKFTIGTNPAAPVWTSKTGLSGIWPFPQAGGMTWRDSDGYLIMFGGKDAFGYENSTFRLDPRQQTWGFINPGIGSPTPSGRTGGLVMQQPGGPVYIYGGENATGVINEALNLSKGSWGYIWSIEAGYARSPIKRAGAVGWADSRNRQWVFGGFDGTTISQELWLGQGRPFTWTTVSLHASAPRPSARRDALGWIDRNQDLVFYGGFDGTNHLNDAWKFTVNTEPANPRWVKVSPPDLTPAGSAGWPAAGPPQATWSDGNKGRLLTGGPDAALWELDFLSHEQKPLTIKTHPGGVYNLYVDVRNFVRTKSTLSIVQPPVQGTANFANFSTDTLSYHAPADWTGTDTISLKLQSPNCREQFTTVTVIVAEKTTDTCAALTQVSASPYTPEGSLPPGRRGVTTWTDGNGDWWIWGGRSVTGLDADDNPIQTDTNELWQFTRRTEPTSPRWINRTPASGGPPPQYRSVGWTGPNGDLWLLQGAELWRYDVSAHTWIDMTPASVQTGAWPHGNHGSPSWTDKDGDFWLFASDNSRLWRYPIGTRPAPHPWWGYFNMFASDQWPYRRAHAMSWTDAHGNLWMFGGQDTYANVDFNDLWKFDPAQIDASPITTQGIRYGSSGETPCSRIAGSTWADAHGDLWLYGGHSDRYGYLSDLWQFTAGTEPLAPRWRDRTPDRATAIWPGPRYMQGVWTDENGDFWSYGGASNYAGAHKNDFWKFDISGLTQTLEMDVNTSATIQPFGANAGGELTLAITVPPASGHASIITAPPAGAPNAVLYTPPPHWTGTDQFTLSASGADCPGSTKTITVHVRPASSSRVSDYELY